MTWLKVLFLPSVRLTGNLFRSGSVSVLEMLNRTSFKHQCQAFKTPADGIAKPETSVQKGWVLQLSSISGGILIYGASYPFIDRFPVGIIGTFWLVVHLVCRAPCCAGTLVRKTIFRTSRRSTHPQFVQFNLVFLSPLLYCKFRASQATFCKHLVPSPEEPSLPWSEQLHVPPIGNQL